MAEKSRSARFMLLNDVEGVGAGVDERLVCRRSISAVNVALPVMMTGVR